MIGWWSLLSYFLSLAAKRIVNCVLRASEATEELHAGNLLGTKLPLVVI